MGQEDNILRNVAQARVTYDRRPTYNIGFYEHPLYLSLQEVFDSPVNAWDLADGADFIRRISHPDVRVENVTFTDWAHRDGMGAATLVQVSSYYFDSTRNSVRFLDLEGHIFEVPVHQYGLEYLSGDDKGGYARMRIPSDVKKDDISVSFSLRYRKSTNEIR